MHRTSLPRCDRIPVKMPHIVPVDDVKCSRFGGGDQEVWIRPPAKPSGRMTEARRREIAVMLAQLGLIAGREVVDDPDSRPVWPLEPRIERQLENGVSVVTPTWKTAAIESERQTFRFPFRYKDNPENRPEGDCRYSTLRRFAHSA